MRAAVLRQPGPAASGPLELTEVADPVAGPDEVVIAVETTAVCRTDLQLCEGDLPARVLPVIPGHQAVGTVVETGPGVDHVLAGDRVGVAWVSSTCGICRFCQAGRENLCDEGRFTGWDRDGGFAERMAARADVTARRRATPDRTRAPDLVRPRGPIIAPPPPTPRASA